MTEGPSAINGIPAAVSRLDQAGARPLDFFNSLVEAATCWGPQLFPSIAVVRRAPCRP